MSKTDPVIVTLYREWDDADPDHTMTYHMEMSGNLHDVPSRFIKRSFKNYFFYRRHISRFAESDAVRL